MPELAGKVWYYMSNAWAACDPQSSCVGPVKAWLSTNWGWGGGMGQHCCSTVRHMLFLLEFYSRRIRSVQNLCQNLFHWLVTINTGQLFTSEFMVSSLPLTNWPMTPSPTPIRLACFTFPVDTVFFFFFNFWFLSDSDNLSTLLERALISNIFCLSSIRPWSAKALSQTSKLNTENF